MNDRELAAVSQALLHGEESSLAVQVELHRFVEQLHTTPPQETIELLRRLVKAAYRPYLVHFGLLPEHERILAAVAEVYQVPVADLLSKKHRNAHTQVARQTAALLVRECTGMSYPRMGALFNRDHSTMIHAVQRAKALETVAPKFAERLQRVRALLAMVVEASDAQRSE